MASSVDTVVKRIAIGVESDLGKAIKHECDIQAGLNKPRRLAASFTYDGELILIFQSEYKSPSQTP